MRKKSIAKNSAICKVCGISIIGNNEVCAKCNDALFDKAKPNIQKELEKNHKTILRVSKGNSFAVIFQTLMLDCLEKIEEERDIDYIYQMINGLSIAISVADEMKDKTLLEFISYFSFAATQACYEWLVLDIKDFDSQESFQHYCQDRDENKKPLEKYLGMFTLSLIELSERNKWPNGFISSLTRL